MYAPVLRAHASDPKNRGPLETANAWGEARYPPCGDLFKLSLRLEGNRLAEVRFEAQACGPVVALGSLATEKLRGMTIQEALGFDCFDWDRAAGGLPPAKRHAILLLLEALQEALGTKASTEGSSS
ncbi:MAG: iron-sulfur cluster assembly scaffold protein [Armatimonadetes bacterium]|nr:iron-sulfur cluster assembly scaffold protein [Armatimonadota bacterium]